MCMQVTLEAKRPEVSYETAQWRCIHPSPPFTTLLSLHLPMCMQVSYETAQ